MFTPRNYQIAAAIGIVFILIVSTYCAPPSSENKDTSEKVAENVQESFAETEPDSELNSDNIDSYLYSLRNPVLADAVKTKMNLKEAGWVELPNKLIQGDRLHNMINPSPPTKREIGANTHFNAIWYNDKAAEIIGNFSQKPEITQAINYPDSTIIVQLESVLDDIEGAYEWEILIDDAGNTGPNPPGGVLPPDFKPSKKTVRLKRISMAFKDPERGWVYAAFSYDKDAKVGEPCTSCVDSYSGLNKLVPIGAEWKTPYRITSIFSNNNKPVQAEFHGIEGKLTSPGNAGLPCAYCHSAAQWNVKNLGLNNPPNLTQYFTGKIHEEVDKKQLPLLFELNTPAFAYCNPANSTNTVIDSIINKICDDPGEDWVALDDDLLLTLAAINALQHKEQEQQEGKK